MKAIVVIGARHRGWISGLPASDQIGSDADRALLRTLASDLQTRFGDQFYVLTLGAGVGFNRAVYDIFTERGVPTSELILRTTSNFSKGERELLNLARHAALLEVASEMFVFRSTGLSHVEDLLGRLEQHPHWHATNGETEYVHFSRT